MAWAENLPFYHYDHRAIKVTLGQFSVWVRKSASSSNSRRFHFEEVWAMDEQCKNLLASAWHSSDSGTGIKEILDRLNVCAKAIDEWGFRKFGSMRRDISRL